MQVMRAVAVGMAVFLAGCGGDGAGGKETTASAPVDTGPHANAVTKQFSIEMGKLGVESTTYVDGLAMRLETGAGAVLTETPLSACAKLAVLAHGNLDFDASRFGETPVLMLVRNEEHPQGAILLAERYSTSTLEDAVPILVTDGDMLIASGDVGDAGWGSIDPTKYGGEKAPHVRLDVKLPYASLDDADPLAADAGAEAKWLREMRTEASIDPQSVVDASVEVDPEDYNGSLTRSAWFDVLANWRSFNVIAAARDTGCATMVLREPGFSGGYQEAIIQTRVVGDAHKVTAAQTRSVDSVEGDYVIGRIEHLALGAFPVLHARAAREDDVGLVVYFSDKPIAIEPFESLVAKQKVVRAVSSIESGDQYSFSHYELGGPGVPVEQVAAGNFASNAHLDEKEIGGVIKLDMHEGALIVVNYRLAWDGAGD